MFFLATDSFLVDLAKLFAPRMSARSKDGYLISTASLCREVNLVTQTNPVT